MPKIANHRKPAILRHFIGKSIISYQLKTAPNHVTIKKQLFSKTKHADKSEKN